MAKLKVDTEELKNYGEYLKQCKSETNTLLDSLNGKMGSVMDSWQDKEGAAFTGKFNGFITDAKNICDEIEKLGIYAEKVASQYETIKNDCLNMMNGG